MDVAINDSGSISGTLLNSTVNTPPTGFVIPAGAAAIAIQVPGSNMTYVTGVNASGTLVGYSFSFSTFNQGFTYSGGTFTPVAAGPSTILTGINNNGDIIGNQGTAFLIHGGVITTFNVPGFSNALPNGLNDSDQVVGSASNSSGPQSGFLRQSNGQFTTLDFLPFGINNAGIIVGGSGSPLDTGSIVMIGGTEYTFSIPGASYTDIGGINNNNEVVGVYGEGFDSYLFEGQLPPLTSTPEPATDAALGMLIISGMLLRRRLLSPA